MAPEVFMHKHYDKSVDVFSFSIIVQEVRRPVQRLLLLHHSYHNFERNLKGLDL